MKRFRGYLDAAATGRVSEIVTVGADSLAQLAGMIRTSGFPTWPINLPGAGITELHIAVLDRQHTVSARRYTRIDAEERTAEGAAFAGLIEALTRQAVEQGMD